jgi:glycosyltransferase involved in cell wall biosynthesis
MQSISLMFPVYNDENTVRIVAEKGLKLLSEIGAPYEIVIVDDGSPDRSGAIADELAREHNAVKVVHHPVNRGYGAAVRSGLAVCTGDVILMTDGDDQYDVFDFKKLLRHVDRYDLIITFRYKKVYSSMRIFISWVYNTLLRLIFRSPFRDISTGLRLVHRRVIEDLYLESNSPFIGAEMAIKAMLKGYSVGEAGIQTFPRGFGEGGSTSTQNIIGTIRDMIAIHRRIFSVEYDRPPEQPH